MQTETEKIEVSAETARLLRRRADAEGIDIDAYLRNLAETGAVSGEGKMSETEIEQVLDALAAGTEDLPPLPEGFSTRDIYAEHD